MNTTNNTKFDINYDIFLYSCLQNDNARQKIIGVFNSHLRFEPFLMDTYRTPLNKNIGTFVDEFREIVKHHYLISPQYKREEKVNLESLSYFSLSVVSLLADYNQLLIHYTSLSLPMLQHNQYDLSEQNTILSEIIEKYNDYEKNINENSFTFSPFSTDEHKFTFANEIWGLFSKIITEFFGVYAEVLIVYPLWKYRESLKVEVIDWRIRPPVGDEFIKYLKSLESKFFHHDKRNHKHYERQPKNTDDASIIKEQTIQAPIIDKEKYDKNSEKKYTPKADKYSNFNTNNGKKDFFNDDRKKDFSDDGRKIEIEQEAQNAINLLLNNPNIKEVKLTTVNSFLRRIQHSYIVNAGFNTESKGEDKERAVFVKRKIN